MPRPVGYVQSIETRAKISAAHILHGHAYAPKNSAELRTWRTWTSMRRRCLQPTDAAYFRYGDVEFLYIHAGTPT